MQGFTLFFSALGSLSMEPHLDWYLNVPCNGTVCVLLLGREREGYIAVVDSLQDLGIITCYAGLHMVFFSALIIEHGTPT